MNLIKKISFVAWVLLICSGLVSAQTFETETDTLFSNSLSYNKLYSDGSVSKGKVNEIIDSIKITYGMKKVALLHKLLNGYFFSKPELARDLAITSLNESKKINNDSLVAFSLHYLGISYNYLEQRYLAIDTYKKALATAYAARADNFKSWCSMNLANQYLMIGEYQKAAEKYFLALKLNEKVKNELFSGKLYINLGELFLEMKNLNESEENYLKSVPILRKYNDVRNEAEVFTNISKLNLYKGKREKAAKYFTDALNKAKELKDSSIIIHVYKEYADILFEKNFFNEAKNLYTDGIKYCDKNNFPVSYYFFLEGIGKTELYNGNIKLAEKYLLQAKEGFQSLPEENKYPSIELTLSKLYAKKGDWEKYNLHFDRYTEISNSNFRMKGLQQVNELNIIHKAEKKDLIIAGQEEQISDKNQKLLLISLFLLITFAGLVVIWNYNQKLRKTYKQLFKSNLELTEKWRQLQKLDELKKISIDKKENLFSKINKLMVTEKYFIDPELNLENLAKKLNSNIKYISKAIKENTGMNFNSFINAHRIEESKKILRGKETRNWSIDAVSEKCGFKNQTSFYQAFKKYTGVTPSVYQKNSENEAA